MADNPQFPDNSLATTRIINSSSTSQFFSNSGADTSYSLDPGDTQDYFLLRLSQRSSVILALNNLTDNADLELLDSGGVLVGSYNTGTLADALTTEPLNAGDYYIRVFLPDPSSSTNYSLSVSTISGARADLLWRNYSTGQNGVWLMDNTSIGSVQLTTTVSDVSWVIEAAADMDGDSIPDYIWRNYANGQIGIWMMDGNGAIRSVQTLTPLTDLNWRIEGAADFNGDGKNDLLLRNYSTFENGIWFMNGTVYSSATFIQPVAGVFMKPSAIADFNGDGNPDILWRNINTGENYIWMMNGIEVESTVSISSGDASYDIAGAGDFDRDGNPDLIWRHRTTGDNYVWYMNGTSLASIGVLPPIGDLNWQIGAVVTSTPKVDLGGDTMTSALDIGTVGNATGIYSDKIGGATDRNDYYKFTLGAPTTFNLALTGLTGNADVWLIQDLNNNGVVDSQAEIVATSVNLGTANEQISNLSLGAGTYFLRIFSPTGESTEYALNIGGIPAQQIDLLVPTTNPASFRVTRTNGSALPTQVSLTVGNSNYLSTIRVYYGVRNNSVNVTPGEFRVSFYISRDNVITSSDRLLGTIDPNTGFSNLDVLISGLASGQTRSGFVDIPMLPAEDQWWGGDQTYYIGMIIDSTGLVAESNEINNAVAFAIGIRDTIRPDILGDGLNAVQTVASPGQAIQLTGAIKNIGNVATGSSRILVNYYLSNDDIYDGSDYFIAQASIAPLARRGTTGDRIVFDSNITLTSNPNASAYFTVQPTLPNLQDWEGWQGNGRYYVMMRIDILSSVQEGSGGKENNSNYGRLIGSYIDYDFIDITGL